MRNERAKSNREAWRRMAAAFLTGAVCLPAGCGDSGGGPVDLRVFHAAGFTPVMDAMRAAPARETGIRLLAESSGSQVACRKVEELGRPCDLLVLADHRLVAELLPSSCSWRLDFATDEIVLGVGIRAPLTDQAEKDWASVLILDNVRFGRVEENQGPIGYRALMTLKLEERRRNLPGMADAIANRAAMIVDDVSRLAPLLRTGELDYAFLYRSTALAMDIRFIPLAPEVNLGRADHDYSSVSVTFRKLGAGPPRTVTMHGAPALWSLTIPDRGADTRTAMRFVLSLLGSHRDDMERSGFAVMEKPVFHGPPERFEPFRGHAIYGGALQ